MNTSRQTLEIKRRSAVNFARKISCKLGICVNRHNRSKRLNDYSLKINLYKNAIKTTKKFLGAVTLDRFRCRK